MREYKFESIKSTLRNEEFAGSDIKRRNLSLNNAGLEQPQFWLSGAIDGVEHT
jgi:hypothetical protein